jgi:hypothetical protein
MSDYKELTPLIADAIIDGLNGSCNSIEQECAFWDIDPIEFMDKYSEQLDNTIFNCESCGWWFDVGEHAESESSGWICQNCETDILDDN